MREQAPCGQQPRPRTDLAVRHFGPVILLFVVVGICSGSSIHADTNDGITLLLHHGATSAQVVLGWTGGSPVYEVYRSANPAALVTPANKLGETNDQAWTDVPPPGGVHFYEIRLRSNQPPVLAAIGNKAATLGQTLTFTVSATDPNSDPVLLSVTPLPLPAHASFDGTTGSFSFRPDGNQVGSFDLTFIASDGSLTDSETITITVPAAGTTTSLSGRVLDANSAAGSQTVPIVTATISLLGTGISATSNAQGFFTLTSVPAGHQVLDITTATAQPGPAGARYGGFREAVQIIGGVENVVERPLFLPRIDETSSTTVDPNATTVVRNETLDVTLTIPPHTAKYQDGSVLHDFIGEISISLVPHGFAPAQLPEYLDPGLVVTIQPVGVFFSSPVPLDFPNIDALPVGNDMELWSLLPTEGRFAVVGRSQISADGQRVETVDGGVRAADWHFVMALRTLLAGGLSAERRCGQSPDGTEQSTCVGSSAGLAEGALQERHSLPSVRSQGIPRTLTLAYDSTTADVRPIVGLDGTLPRLAAVPEQFSMTLEVGNMTQGATTFYDSSSLPEDADSTSRLVAQFDASSLSTGRYPLSADIFSRYPSSRVGATIDDDLVIINRRDSPVGAGWGFAGLQRLYVQLDGSALIEDGTGGALVFEPAAQGSFTAIDPMNSRRGDNPLAVALSDGRVIVAGGTTGNTSQFNTAAASAEFFDPSAEAPDPAWTTLVDVMNTARVGPPQATTLPDGRILIVGGGNGSGALRDAEIYDPATEQFTSTSSTNDPRNGTATRLSDGTVLIAGGRTFATAEIYDPVSDTFIRTNGDMDVARFNHTATLLQDGRVLIAGGQPDCGLNTAIQTAIIYDPASRLFTPKGGMTVDRSGHTATLLADGRVLITGGVGGLDNNGCAPVKFRNTVEIYDPVTGASEGLTATLCAAKSHHSAISLQDGRVLIAGGWAGDPNTGSGENATACADLFDPVTKTIVHLPGMNAARGEFAMVALQDGRVLLAGGGTAPSTPVLQSAEIFSLSTETGTYVAPAGEFSALTKDMDGTFVRHYKDGADVHFDATGLETSVVDRNGNTTSYGYGTGGRLESMTDPKSQVWTVSYDASGKLQSIADPASRTTSFTHDARGDLIRITKTDGASVGYSYDSQHRLTGRTDERGNAVIYAYNFAGRMVSATHPEGEVRQVQPTTVQGLVDLTSGAGTVGNPAPIVASGSVVATTTDGNGHSGSVTLNRFGSALRREDAIGRVTQTIRDANNLPTQITRPNNSVVNMTYDTRGNLLTVTEESDPNGPATTTFTYDPVFNQVTSIEDARENTTTIVLDAQGNPETITDARSKITTLTWLPGGLLESVEDPLHHTTTFAYDTLGNLDTITDPLLKVTDIDPDAAGNVHKVTDPKLHMTQYEHDSQNRLTEIIDPESGHTKYRYDLKGNLTSLTDARGKITRLDYNNRDLLKALTNPLGQSRTFIYDLAENLRFANDAKGQQIEFVHDTANQLLTKILRNSSLVVTDTAHFTYDTLGTLATASDADSSLAFTPDFLGRIQSAATSGTQPVTSVSYTYDKNGNRKTMTDPQGFETVYDYDELNRLTTLTSHQGIFTFGNDDAGRRENLEYPNGVTLSYAYDDANQPTALHLLDSNQTLLSKFDYTYDDADNRATRTTNDGLTTYTNDSLDRLTAAVGPDPSSPQLTLTEQYGYDAVGNRTSSHFASGQVYDNANRLLEDSQFTYGYDFNGNLASKQDKTTSALTTYDWDVDDQLVGIHTPSQTIEILYDALGRRIQRTGTATTTYIYDAEDVLEERDAGGNLNVRYVHGPGIDEPLSVRDVSAGHTAFLHSDGLGSLVDGTDSLGQLTPLYRYDSFGRLPIGQTASGFAFTGRQWDSDTGLYYYRYRYYDPQTGRFISEDPLGPSGDINGYRYALDNPTNFVDPSGLLTWGEALRRYTSARGGILDTPFSDHDPGFGPQVFPGFDAAMSQGASMSFFSELGYDTGQAPGRIVLILTGAIDCSEVCGRPSCVFKGHISARDDPWDFDEAKWGERDPGGFPYWKELKTRFGERFLPGVPFTTRFIGQRSVKAWR